MIDSWENRFKIFSISVIVILLASGASAGLVDDLAGEIGKYVLSADTVSGKWVGVSGDVGEYQDISRKPVFELSLSDSDTGEVQNIDIPGRLRDPYYFAAMPLTGEEFNKTSLESASLQDVDKGQLFPENNYPEFYPGYQDLSDAPDETFTEKTYIKLLDNNYSVLKTSLDTGIDYYLLKYNSGGEEYPLFLVDVQSYSNCYNGKNCNFQFLLPMTESSAYSFYQLTPSDPVNMTSWINGNKSSSFGFPGRPYRLKIRAKTVFGEQPVDANISVAEQNGQNLFLPSAVKSDARLENTSTSGYTQEMLVTPTGYQAGENYSFQLRSYRNRDFIRSERIKVEKKYLEPGGESPEEIGLDRFSSRYKENVNRLRSLLECASEKIKNDRVYNLTITGSGEKKVVKGAPYRVNVENAEEYSIVENRSLLMVSPTGKKTLHRGGNFSSDTQTVFVPTGSGNITLKAFDSSGLVYENRLEPGVGTCSGSGDGVVAELKTERVGERINAMKLLLNSMYAAGKS